MSLVSLHKCDNTSSRYTSSSLVVGISPTLPDPEMHSLAVFVRQSTQTLCDRLSNTKWLSKDSEQTERWGDSDDGVDMQTA